MGGEVTPAAASTSNPTISKVVQFIHRCTMNVNLHAQYSDKVLLLLVASA